MMRMCPRYQANPKESHLANVKKVIKYVCCTLNYGIWYTTDTSLSLVGFCDADWAGSTEDRKKHNSISLSTLEA